MSSDGKKDMTIPTGRTMPSEQRLEPPRWPEGRTEAPNGEFRLIGRRNRKIEGLAKVTGQAIYADDLRLPRMICAKLLRSIHAHARIRSIDASAALALPAFTPSSPARTCRSTTASSRGPRTSRRCASPRRATWVMRSRRSPPTRS
jgi:hypothetical protein